MLIPTGYAQVNYRLTGTGVPNGAEITMGLDVNGFTGTVADAAAAAFDAAEPLMSSQISNSVSITEVLMKYGPNATGPQVVDTGNFTGGSSGPAVPPNTSVLVTKITGAGGRTGRGRFYLPGIDETIVTNGGEIPPANMPTLQGSVDAFWTNLVNADLIPALLHAPGSPISAPLPIVGFVVSNRVATQRRRLRR